VISVGFFIDEKKCRDTLQFEMKLKLCKKGFVVTGITMNNLP